MRAAQVHTHLLFNLIIVAWQMCRSDSYRMRSKNKRASCPTGLVENQTTPPTCQWPVLTYSSPADEDVLDDIFSGSSDQPLSWDLERGSFLFTDEFLDEFKVALEDENFCHRMLLGRILDLEHGHGRTTKQAFLDVLSSAGRSWKEIAVPANLARMAIMPTSIITGLKTAAAWGIIAGGSWIPVVGWAATAVIALYGLSTVSFHYAKEDKLARETTEMIAMRVRCVKSMFELTPKMASDRYNEGRFFREDVVDVCVSEVEQVQVVAVMQRANFALRELLEAVEEYATCLFPGPWKLYGENGIIGRPMYYTNRTRKSSCFAVANEMLIRLKDSPGLLTTTLSLITAYAKSTDEMLREPIYGRWMTRKFGVTIEAGGVMKSIKAQVAENQDIQDEDQAKLTSCMMLAATHRAYEMTFKRLAKAWKIYAQTYLRDALHVSARNPTAVYPCREVFTEIDEGSESDDEPSSTTTTSISTKRQPLPPPPHPPPPTARRPPLPPPRHPPPHLGPLSPPPPPPLKNPSIPELPLCKNELFTVNGSVHVTGGTFAFESSRKYVNIKNVNEVCEFAQDHDSWKIEDEDTREDTEDDDLDA